MVDFLRSADGIGPDSVEIHRGTVDPLDDLLRYVICQILEHGPADIHPLPSADAGGETLAKVSGEK